MKANSQLKIIGFLFGVVFLYYFLYASPLSYKKIKHNKYLKRKLNDLKNNISTVNNNLIDKGFKIKLKKRADKRTVSKIISKINSSKKIVENKKLNIIPFMINKNDILTVIENLTVVPNMKNISVEFISFSENKILKVINNNTVYYQYTAPIKLRADFKHFFKYLDYIRSFNKLFIIDNFVLNYNPNVEYLSANFKLKFFVNIKNNENYKIKPKYISDFQNSDITKISSIIYKRRKKTVLKRSWDNPVLTIKEYENPDVDGKFILNWNKEKDVEYSLIRNGNIVSKLSNPYIEELEENGRYIYKVRGKTYDDQVIESNKIEVIVDIEPVELPELQGIVSINNEKVALINNKIYKENDIIQEFVIKKIEDRKVLLNFKLKEYEIELPKSLKNKK